MSVLIDAKTEKNNNNIELRKLEIQTDKVGKLFLYFDKDQDGSLSVKEFENFVQEIGEIMTDQQLQECFTQLDKNRSGAIELEDFSCWWESNNHQTDQFFEERLNIIKSKLHSKFFMKKFLEDRLGVLHEPNPVNLNNDDKLTASLNIDIGGITHTEVAVRLTHRHDAVAVSRFRLLLGAKESHSLVSIAFSCNSNLNIAQLNTTCAYLTKITESRLKEEKLSVQEFKWHVSEDDGNFLRATAVLPAGFSMSGAGLLRSIGVNDMLLNINFGGGNSRLGFRAEVSRTTALVGDLLSNPDIKSFYRFFLNYFCGAVLKFQFTSVEEVMAHTIASPLLKIQDNFVYNLIQSGHKLTSKSCKSNNAHMELLQLILLFFGNHNVLLDFFEVAWFAIESAKDNIEQVSNITVVVGNELFQVELNVPQLLKLFSYTSLFLPNQSTDNNTE